MSPAQRRYLVVQAGIGAAIVNAVLNGGLGWLFTRGLLELPLWRVPGIAADLVGTAFGVTFGTCLMVGFQVRKDVAQGKVDAMPVPANLAAVIGRFPAGALRRGLGLGVLSIPIFAAPVLLVLVGFGVDVLARSPFLVLKTGLAAVQGGLITPLIVLAILADLARK